MSEVLIPEPVTPALCWGLRLLLARIPGQARDDSFWNRCASVEVGAW